MMEMSLKALGPLAALSGGYPSSRMIGPPEKSKVNASGPRPFDPPGHRRLFAEGATKVTQDDEMGARFSTPQRR